MSSASKGILFTIASAVIFGFTPILARIAYDGGANGVTMTFLRAVLSLPVLFAILVYQKVPLRITRRQTLDIFLAGGIGNAVTTILLYVSYSFISVGMATTLHFIYPIMVSLSCVVFFREKLTWSTVFALVASTAGVFMFTGKIEAGSVTGFALALLSGVTFAFYIVYTDRTDLKNIHYFKLSFYLCIVLALFSGVFGLMTGTLTFDLTPKAWLYALIVSLFVSVGAVTLLQLGIRLSGATAASILSTFEPITSFVLGILVLHEEISTAKIVGCLCIVAGVIVVAMSKSPGAPPRKKACPQPPAAR